MSWRDREPQPSDGPDYHEEHNAWVRRNCPCPDPLREVMPHCSIHGLEAALSERAPSDQPDTASERDIGPFSALEDNA